MFIYFWETERERERKRERGRERERERERSSLCANSREPNVGLELTNHEIVAWAKVRCSTNWATQEPQGWNSYKVKFCENSILYLLFHCLSESSLSNDVWLSFYLSLNNMTDFDFLFLSIIAWILSIQVRQFTTRQKYIISNT